MKDLVRGVRGLIALLSVVKDHHTVTGLV